MQALTRLVLVSVLAFSPAGLLLASPEPDVGGTWVDDGVKIGASTQGDEGPGTSDETQGPDSGDTSVPAWDPAAMQHGVSCDASDRCPGSSSSSPSTTAPAAPGTPGITDVARFLVGDPTVTSEPNGWTVAGLETNFIASAGEREQAGELLGQPVTVHFTPVAYEWRYGDGSRRTSATPGASWQASDLPDFSRTATSHAYETRGSYTVTATVEFGARYRFAGRGWADIAGTLTLTSDPITVTVKGVKTVLVGETCDENPLGPGC